MLGMLRVKASKGRGVKVSKSRSSLSGEHKREKQRKDRAASTEQGEKREPARGG
jgi:hypothetical protein